jgi:hypothetical protein
VPFIRGNGSIDVELARVQSYLEFVGVDIEAMIHEYDERKALRKFVTIMVTLMAAFGGTPAVILLLQIMHILPVVK